MASMKLFGFTLLLIILCNCSNNQSKRTKLIDFVPDKTALILKTTNFENLKSSIHNSDFLESISKNDSYKNLKENLKPLSLLKPIGNVLLCFSKDPNNNLQYSVITKFSKGLFLRDSLSDYKEETLTYKNKSIIKSTFNKNILYSAIIDSTFFASSSQSLVENAFNKTLKNVALEKMYHTTGNDKTLSLIITGNENPFVKSFFINDSLSLNTFTNYVALDVDISQDQIYINGITKANDSSKSLINIFKNSKAQENQIQNITPINSDGFMGFTFDKFKIFEAKLAAFNNKDSIPNTPLLFNDINEIGIIYEANDRAIVLNSLDIIVTKEALLGEQTPIGSFRQVDIFSFSNPDLFRKIFYPLIHFNKASKYCVLDTFFVFADNLELLENIIANYQNKSTLSESNYFKGIKEQLSDASSLMMVVNPSKLNTILNTNFETASNYKLDAYNASALQFVYDNNFAHVNGIIKKTKNRASQNSITEELNIKLDTDLLNTPQFVINHISKQKEIVVQDVNNNLYLISNTGKILWKKKLRGPVLGKIEQIDIYKNSRLQLAFATPDRIYVLDRNGNDVAPFPGKFNDVITQPLSVFDYDNNKKYRLMVTQGKKVLMFNTSAEQVKGFTFLPAKSPIINQPTHFRIGRKDYITFKTDNKLYILDRTGKIRVTPKTSTRFSNEAVYLYNDKFTTTTDKGDLIMVDSKGNTATQNLNLAANHHLITTSRTLVSLSDNKLSIKNKTVELDYGNYTSPNIFYINDKIYVSVSDLQSQKVYLYDSQAELLPNFPVYGNSVITLDNIDSDNALEFVLKGESNSIILYQLN